MKIEMNCITPILKFRFTAPFMYVEGKILDHMGKKYYDGDKVDWEAHRREAYVMYHAGFNNEEVAAEHGIPVTIVEWWVHIWVCYDNAWGFVN